ncbi:C39 family peptidase [Pseudalkalibacillus caeni]|uniref:Peptidase C39 n=1 Tax=Exobacillus caeni TaxID=2574798 RepID=A0A5R9F6J2_9BACL|nr:C39 family peptidase [Pseudalkalibacillus caeni]TLS37966.1 peptidase C39 [Pseudalkalibacillus caeni]
MKTLLNLVIVFTLIGCSTTEAGQRHENAANQPAQTKELQVKEPVEKKAAGTRPNAKKISAPEVKKEKGKQKVILDVPLIKQNPELKYGCEVTSLAMVLQYAGIKADKMSLYRKIAKDNDPIRKTRQGNITDWGDPNDGFVGDMTGKNAGYAVFDKPMEQLMEAYLPERTVNLTGKPFKQIELQIDNNRPVVVWTTGDYRLPDRWESWRHGKEKIKTPLDLHAVVLVGYDRENVYLNDPLSGKKEVKVNKKQFIDSWIALKKQALSYR